MTAFEQRTPESRAEANGEAWIPVKARPRTVTIQGGGTITLPDVEANGVIALGCWVKRSPIPGTPPWEWVIYNMPVTAVTGMSAGYTYTRQLAELKAAEALDFWESYGYPINRDGLKGGDE